MDFRDIIKVASDAYPDGLVEQAAEGEPVGDGLAEFIARELRQVSAAMSFSGAVRESVRAISRAESELSQVRIALEDLRTACLRIDSYAKRNELPLLIGEFKKCPIAQKYLEHRIKEAENGRS